MDNPRERVFTLLPTLVEQLRKTDAMYLAKPELNREAIKNWYFQHILVKAIQQFSIKKDLVLPKHLLRYAVCFDNDPMMLKIYNHLIGLPNPDRDVLVNGMDQLMQAIKTQALDVLVTDEITQWRISLTI